MSKEVLRGASDAEVLQNVKTYVKERCACGTLGLGRSRTVPGP